MNILKIRKAGLQSWTEIADPTAMQWDLTDMDSDDGSGRNQMGQTFRDRITQKRQLNCSWGQLEDTAMKELLSCINDNFFELEYPDALTGERRISSFYVSSRQAPMYKYDAKQDKWLWTGLSAVFTER